MNTMRGTPGEVPKKAGTVTDSTAAAVGINAETTYPTTVGMTNLGASEMGTGLSAEAERPIDRAALEMQEG